MKHRLLAALAFAALLIAGCKKPDPQQNIDPESLDYLTMTADVNNNWVFDGKPVFIVKADNPNEVDLTAEMRVDIRTDQGVLQTTYYQTVEVPAKGKKEITITADKDLPAGFYKARIMVTTIWGENIIGSKNRGVRSFTFGVNPTEIVSAPDMQADFNTFWDATLAQLEATPMDASLTYIKTVSNRKIYLVEMNSIADGLTGDPVKIHGYYCEPQDGNKHPVLMHYFGYDVLNPSGKMALYTGVSSDYAEFYLSTRGQIINNRTASQRSDGVEQDFSNEYGDWFAANFGDRDSYYYRGAFMDCVQGVRFMAQQPTSDMNNVFAEGSSQGGAFSYATAALSPYKLNAIAPNVAFLGDFPDYFNIVPWPADVAKANKGSMSDEEMYRFLSYFDTKNLATRITSTAVMATIGLQDVTCPPHTNIAPYNNLPHNDKEIHFYPEMQHSYPPNWDGMCLNFFKNYMQ